MPGRRERTGTIRYTPRVAALSAVLITLNEELRLPEALASVAFCDETLVVDAGSSDRTVAIAQAAGARVIINAPWPGFVPQRNLALDQARHDWILALDADERVSEPLCREIQSLAADGPGLAGYRIPRLTHYLGRWIRATDWYPDWQLRLFDRRRGRWQGRRVHESVRVAGPVGRLRSPIEHHPYADIAAHLATIDRYTTLWAQQAFEDGRRAGVLKMTLAPLAAFVRNYVLKRGFTLGEAGLVVSALGSYYTFVKLAKLRERSRGGTPAS